MQKALLGQPEARLKKPLGMVTVKIDRKTGLLARPGTPKAVSETFRSEYVPNEYSPMSSKKNKPSEKSEPLIDIF